MYDDRYLYAAYQGKVPRGQRERWDPADPMVGLLVARLRTDELPDQGDNFEVVVNPDLSGTWYRLLTNQRDTRYDAQIKAGGLLDVGWTPDWESASRISPDGWTVEVCIPLTSFGRDAPSPGTTWGMNFRRIWRQFDFGIDEWATGSRIRGADTTFWSGPESASSGSGKVRFGDEQDLVPQLAVLAPLNSSNPEIVLHLLNPSAERKTAKIRLTSDCGTITDSRSLSIEQGGRSTCRFSGELTTPGFSQLTLEAVDGNGKPVYRSDFFYEGREGPSCTIRHFPTHERLEFSWDLSSFKQIPIAELAIEAFFIDKKTGQPVLRAGLASLESHSPRMGLRTSELAEGTYALVTIIGHQRKEIGRTLHFFEKRPKAPWQGMFDGLRGEVPPPFEPIRIEGTGGIAPRKVSVIGRTYDFGRSSLPDQIYVNNEPILAGPIRLRSIRPNGRKRDLARDLVWGREGGNPLVFRAHTVRQDRVEWESYSSARNKVMPGISGWAEYDGLLWFKVRVIGNKWPGLTFLQLQVPLKKEYSPYYAAGSGPREVPEGGLSLSQGPVWLGNREGGLQWMAESTASWHLENPQEAIRILPQEDRNLLVVTLIDHEVDLPGGFSAEFGLVATPVRPGEPQDLEKLQASEGVLRPLGHRKELNPLHWLAPNSQPPPVDGCVSLSLCAADRSPAGQAFLRQADYFFYEWAALQSQKWTSGAKRIHSSPSSRSWQGYLAWVCQTRYGRKPFAKLIIENAAPVLHDNRFAGGGISTKGKRYPKWSILGSRELLKLLYTQHRLRDPGGRVCLKDARAARFAPLRAFCDEVLSETESGPAGREARE